MSGITNGINGNLIGTSANPINPLLAPLGNYGGPTQTMALLPGSPAIDAGSPNAPSTDQRGMSRVGTPDIGAFESQGFTLSITSGNNQNTQVSTTFGKPLVVTLTSSYGEPVAGGQVIFTAPVTGSSASLNGTPATIGNNGTASVTATADGTGGTYGITATTAGAAGSVNFSLTNTQSSSLQVTTLLDDTNASDGQTSSREALAYASKNPGNNLITFAPGLSGTITLTQGPLLVAGNVTISGPGSNVLAISGNKAGLVFNICGYAQVVISGLTITQGTGVAGGAVVNGGTLTLTNDILTSNSGDDGGVIYNATYSTLTVIDSTFSDNSSGWAGGIFNMGTLTVTDSTFLGNSVSQLSNGGGIVGGGAISNGGSLTVTSSTFSDNSANEGGAICNGGSLTLTNSTLSGNTAKEGGAICNISFDFGISNCGTVTVTNSTINGNFAEEGGGIANWEGGTVTVTNSTLSNNSASDKGGAIENESTLTVTNSTFSGNSAKNYGGAISNYNRSTATVTSSTLSGNSATDGGAIYNYGATMMVTTSTLNGNSASIGGGIWNYGTMTVTNSTLSGNSVSKLGGGVSNNCGTLTLSSSTLSGNSAPATGGGGIWNSSRYATMTVTNTIVAGNKSGPSPDISGWTDPGGNDNLIGGNPLLAPLGNYGGPTQTMALLPGSPAIDAGSPNAPSTDQRGVSRVGTPDIGRFRVAGLHSGPHQRQQSKRPGVQRFRPSPRRDCDQFLWRTCVRR